MRTSGLARRGADAALVVGVATALAAVAAHALDRHVPLDTVLPEDARAMWLVNAALAISWVVPGWYLVRHRAGVAFGWLALAAGVGHGLAALGLEWAIAGVVMSHGLPAPTLGLWLAGGGLLGEPPLLLAAYGLFPPRPLPRGGEGPAGDGQG